MLITVKPIYLHFSKMFVGAVREEPLYPFLFSDKVRTEQLQKEESVCVIGS